AVFFFKQKTAYEISRDWSSDVCSSDLTRGRGPDPAQLRPGPRHQLQHRIGFDDIVIRPGLKPADPVHFLGTGREHDDRGGAGFQIGRASCREGEPAPGVVLYSKSKVSW